MKIGLIGLPGSGKSTVFRMLTGKQDRTGHGSDLAVVEVPDSRTELIFQICSPQRLVQPEITFLDLMALGRGDSSAGEELELLKVAGDADAFALILQCFGEIDARGEPLDAAEDLDTVLLEMALTDLGIIEDRLARLAAKGGRQEAHERWEAELLECCRKPLASGRTLRELELADDERKHLRGFSLLTMKPCLVVLNVAEDDLAGERAAGARALSEQRGLAWMALCAELEEEIAQLPPTEQAGFAVGFGLDTLGRDRSIRAAYELLNIITFFTVNEKEVHAWTLPAGATAPEAAGKVHTDMQQGFIRAEVIPCEALEQAGSLKACREQGLMRVEGRDYVVADGDIIQVRFSR